jgi:hypothetical protein
MTGGIDKLGREAKSAKNFDQLLGPAPEGSLGTIDLLATALPSARPGGPAPAVAPPPSDFRFQGPGPGSAPVSQPPARPGTPPPFRAATAPGVASSPPAPPPPRPSQQMSAPPSPRPTPQPRPTPPPMPAMSPPRPSQQMSAPLPPRPSQQMSAPPPPRPSQPPLDLFDQQAPLNLDDDLGMRGSAAQGASRVNPYFKQVFDQFVSVKQNCNESIAGLSYDKFAEKLVKNRDDLVTKTGCREVRFTVYVKDGKAALKATPVKDEP